MKLKNILCPVDMSPGSAIEFASRLAKATDATLHFLFVEENFAPYGIGLYGQLPVPVDVDAHTLDNVQPTLEGIPFERHVVLGIATREIIKFALDHKVDVIVMGTHGRTGAARALMGSVAEGVVRQAPCAVITVKQRSEEPKPTQAEEPSMP